MLRAKKRPSKATRTRSGATLPELNRALPGNTYRPQGRVASTGRDTKSAVTAEPQRRLKKIVWWTVGCIVALLILVGGWVAWKFVANEVRIFGWRGLIGLIWPEKLAGEDEGHVNVLLAGNSADDAGHSGASLTDSIMILSVNPKNNTAFMLSVPRDLYVNIPGHGYAKINETYQIGGMSLLQQVVAEHFGITLNYYALVDYAAVRDAVNAVGGIDVTIQSADPRGLYDPSIDYANDNKPLVDLANGTHHLNGAEALALARARGNHYRAYGFELGDFQRTANQQQIMIGLKNRAGSLSTLANPIKLGELFDAVGQNVQTDMSLGNVRRLYNIMKKIPDGSIVTGALNTANGDSNLLQNYTTEHGQSALVPTLGLDDYGDIQAYVTELLSK